MLDLAPNEVGFSFLHSPGLFVILLQLGNSFKHEKNASLSLSLTITLSAAAFSNMCSSVHRFGHAT